MSELCYWCAKPATSKEHVPPKCLFPKIKDAPGLGDQRKELITVPSCDKHNSEKSEDDEYLMCILSVNILNNHTAETHVKSKIIRALQRSPYLMSQCFGTNIDIAISQDGGRTLQPTKAIKVDDDRLDTCLEHISRAIYFHVFNERHTGRVQCTPEFLAAVTRDDARQRNEQYERFCSYCDQAFEHAEALGQNRDVFYYQVLNEPDERMKAILRLTFFEGAKATAIFYA